MADATGNEEDYVLDMNKMKIADLKRELHIRGLKISGNKSELMERLQKYLEEHEGAEIEDDDEEAALLAEVDTPSVKTPEKHIASAGNDKNEMNREESAASLSTADQASEAPVAIVNVDEGKETTKSKPISVMTEQEKKEARAKKFGLKPNELSESARKEARAKKFGLKTADLNDTDRIEKRKQRFGDSAQNGKSVSKSDDTEKLKKRAERFGSVASSTSNKSQQDDALEKRKKRFGNISTAESELDIKKAKRAERFKNVAVTA